MPVRSAILGAVLAIAVVTATFTFGSSLDTLVSHPALYGWNWNSMLLSGFSGDEDLPQGQTDRLLSHDPYVSGFTGVYFDTLEFDGRTVPVLGADPGAPVQPPLLSGNGFERSDQVLLGATTLAELHKHVGDVVTVSNGQTPDTAHHRGNRHDAGDRHAEGAPRNGDRCLARLPDHPGHGAQPPAEHRAGSQRLPHPHPPGANPTLAARSLRRINATLSASSDGSGGVVGVLRPAEIANYHSIGSTPAVLGAALAAGAVVALGLTLLASVRRRRRDLALLKTLGFTQRQLAAAVAWQSTVAVGVGAIVGVPLGIVVGRILWDLFARDIHAVPAPSVPALTVVLTAVVALVLANAVAAIPGRIAARTPTALILRSE